jgi:hypothetical protein
MHASVPPQWDVVRDEVVLVQEGNITLSIFSPWCNDV